MHVEVQVALNFLISFLYNKLPRRRVNQFGEELEATLKSKFEGHWYPEHPYKGSAFRCIRCAPPLDPFVFEVAARNAGMNLLDIQQNLPQELSIWVDPGEVSYRISEKGPVKILFSERSRINEHAIAEPAAVSGLNPEAQCFKPVEHHLASVLPNLNAQSVPPPLVAVSAPLVNKNSNPVTFTTATFAATKFGSTKLKTNGNKKGQRSPSTDFGGFSVKPKSHVHVSKDCNGPWVNRRNGASPFGNNNIDLFDLSDFDSWKGSSTTQAVYTSQLPNIWASKPQMSPQKVDAQNNETLFEGDSRFGSETFDPVRQHIFSNTASASNQAAKTQGLGLLDNSQLSLLSERLWDEIFSISPEIYADASTNESTVGSDQSSTRNDPFFCSSFSLSSMSSPSLSSSNESCSLNLVNEFDNLSLNSSSSSAGSASSSSSSSSSSYIT